MKLKIVVFLKHSVNAFNLSHDLFHKMQADFPEFEWILLPSIQDFKRYQHDAHVFITWKFKAIWYTNAKNLRYIITPAAGKDWIEPDPTGSVTTVFGTFHGKLISETVLAMILFFNRRFNRIIKNQQLHLWDRQIQSTTKQLDGQNILIIGYGTIGRAIAVKLHSMGCLLKGVQRSIPSGIDNQTTAEYVTPEALPQLYAWPDHIISVLPADATTDSFFTEEHFRSMKPSAFFYNVGRGNCYKESVLFDALQKKCIAGAGLDVFEKEPLPGESALWALDNVLITPHSAAIYQNYLPLWYNELKPFLSKMHLQLN